MPQSQHRNPSDYIPELSIGLGGSAFAMGAGLLGATNEAIFSGVVFGGVSFVAGELVMGSPVRRSAKKAWDAMLDKTEASVVRAALIARHPVRTSRHAWAAVAKKARTLKVAHDARWQHAYMPHAEQRLRMVPIATGMSAFPMRATLARR